MGSKLTHLGLRRCFVNLVPKTWEVKAKISKWDYIKLNCSCIAKKKKINKTKRQPIKWDKIFANYTSDKGLVSKIYKELMQLNKNKQFNLKNWERT